MKNHQLARKLAALLRPRYSEQLPRRYSLCLKSWHAAENPGEALVIELRQGWRTYLDTVLIDLPETGAAGKSMVAATVVERIETTYAHLVKRAHREVTDGPRKLWFAQGDRVIIQSLDSSQLSMSIRGQEGIILAVNTPKERRELFGADYQVKLLGGTDDRIYALREEMLKPA